VLYAGTSSLSSFLLFLVQPLIARLILPWFGGSAAVWTPACCSSTRCCSRGYAYAHLLQKYASRRVEPLIHIAVLVAAVATLQIAPNEAWKRPTRLKASASAPGSARGRPFVRGLSTAPPPAPVIGFDDGETLQNS
jgi:hypothetical protein